MSNFTAVTQHLCCSTVKNTLEIC